MNKLATVPKSTTLETHPFPAQAHAVKIPKGRAIPNAESPSPNVRIANNRSAGEDKKKTIKIPNNIVKQRTDDINLRIILIRLKFMRPIQTL
jgi:hypothetical protein